jgi:hypothetical protein
MSEEATRERDIDRDCNCPPQRCFAEEKNDIGQTSAYVCPRRQLVDGGKGAA